jgi:hypothetical protein
LFLKIIAVSACCAPPTPHPGSAQLVNPNYEDLITPFKAITEQPFWTPSQSLQLKMVTHAHTLIEVLNQVRWQRAACLDWVLGAIVFMSIWGAEADGYNILYKNGVDTFTKRYSPHCHAL